MARKILTSSRLPQDGNLHYYYLPKGLLELTVSRRKFEGNSMIEVDTKERYIPDPDHRYYLCYHANPFTHDKIAIEFHESGFLKKLSATIEDKTLEVIDKVFKVGEEGGKALVGLRSLAEKEPIHKVTIDPFDDDDMQRLNNELELLNTGMTVSISSMKRTDDLPTEYKAPEKTDHGIFCRPSEPYEIIVQSGRVEQRQIVILPNPNIIHLIHLPSTRFVSNEFLVECGPLGYPTKINLGKPSQALQILEIPLKILQAIIRIPAEIFQFRINYNTDKQSLRESEWQLHERIKALNKKQEDLKKEVDDMKK